MLADAVPTWLSIVSIVISTMGSVVAISIAVTKWMKRQVREIVEDVLKEAKP